MSTDKHAFTPIFQHWQDWGLRQTPRLVKHFTKGKNHHTALIESGGEHYVVKRFNHSAKHAIESQKIASRDGLAPAVLRFKDDLCLMQFAQQCLPTIDELGTSLNQLHTSLDYPQAERLDLMACYNAYLQSASDQTQQQHHELYAILTEFINDSTEWCFCHNDLVNENCLTNSRGKALFIDWEFATHHNPWFDLASVIVYRNLNQSQASVFLHHYRGWENKVHQRIFLTSQIAVLWADILWHISTFGEGPSEHNSTQRAKLDALLLTL